MDIRRLTIWRRRAEAVRTVALTLACVCGFEDGSNGCVEAGFCSAENRIANLETALDVS